MKLVTPPVKLPEDWQPDDSKHTTRSVIALAAGLDEVSGTVCVKFLAENERIYAFVLEPPTAKLLQEEIGKAIDDYLHMEVRKERGPGGGCEPVT